MKIVWKVILSIFSIFLTMLVVVAVLEFGKSRTWVVFMAAFLFVAPMLFIIWRKAINGGMPLVSEALTMTTPKAILIIGLLAIAATTWMLRYDHVRIGVKNDRWTGEMCILQSNNWECS